MRKFFSVLMLSMGLMYAYATNVTYTADNTSIFPNPERGFTEELGGETMLTNSNNHVIQPEADWYFESSGDRASQSLVVVIYYLGNYRSKDLSSQILQGFDEDMQILRNKGFKCVLRFAYDWNSNNDATLAWTKRHIEQLKPHLAANADVIYVLQTGFVGQWGEWYYSSHHGNETQDLTANRREILEAMIDACPSDRFLLVRYPMIKTDYLGDNNALTSAQAFTTATRARIGHHNDAFLNAYGNDGTYASHNSGDDPAVRQYIADETLYVPNGGETNVESSSKANSVYTQAESEMSMYHWSFCGSTYAEAVTNKWRSSGIYNNLDRKMGYRYQLVSGTFSDQVAPGGKLSVNLQIRNTGYAPLYNERHAYIVLKNGNKVYSLQLNSDPRRWLPNDAVTTINEQLTVPTNVPAGTYQLYIHMPDKYASLASNPKFSIRFANQGNLWEASTGMNKLNASVVVSGSAVTPDPDPDPDPDPQPQEGAIQLPATLNKANVTAYSSDMTWYNTDYFDFGPTDATNTDRWAEWTVYLKHPKAYDVSEVSYCLNGHTFSLKLMDGTTEVASYTTTDDHWGAGDQSYTQSAKWDLSAVPAGTYTLRIQNATEWGQPKMKSITLFADVPADPDPDPDPDPQPQEGAIQLPATVNKANVTTYSSDMTWYNTDYFNFGPDDNPNLDRWAEWTVYLKYPKAYEVSEVSYCENGHTFSLKLMNGTSEVASYTTTDDHWGAGDQSYTQSTPWDLSAVPVGTYTLRIKNATEWGQPKMKSITLSAEVPTGMEDVQSDDVQCTKVIRNGLLFIIREGKVYTVTGQEIR